jgi:hypothetical protein
MAETMREDDEDELPSGADNEEIVIVEDGADDNQDDQRLGSNEDEREAIRERRRQEKLERKDRRKEAISRDKLELDFLRKRNDDLERRISAQEHRAYRGDLQNLDSHIAAAANEAQMAERVIAKAVESGNGDDVTQAMRYRDQAIIKYQQLSAMKQQEAQRAAMPPPAAQIDDLTMHHASEFLKENTWYDPQGRDEDSAILLAIDNAIVKEGFNPQTEEYWDELRSRAAKRLPERFKASRSERREPRGGPAVGSGREHAPATTRREVYISPERKQALIEAGVWDDPVLRMKYVKRYAEYDRSNKA